MLEIKQKYRLQAPYDPSYVDQSDHRIYAYTNQSDHLQVQPT